MPKWAIALVTVGAIGLVAGLIVWKIRDLMATECEVCVEYEGRTNCATAAGKDAAAAVRTAQSTACATIAGGMTAGMACEHSEPTQRVCRNR